jgi:hypothetical protein
MGFVSYAQAAGEPEYVPGEIIVKLKGKAKATKSQAFIGKAVSEKAMTLKGSWAGLNMHHFALKPGQDVEVTLKELQADPDVEYAEPNYIFRRMSVEDPGPLVSMSEVQAAADSSNASASSTYQSTRAPIQLSEGWSSASSSATPPVVAVIDTGLDLSHDVFVQTGAIWVNPGEGSTPNGVDDDSNGFVDDIHGWNFVANNNAPIDDDSHGTHVSGIILGVTQDIFAASLQPAKIRIMPLKFLDKNGQGTTSDAVKAIYYAVNNGAKVINNSWGGGGFSNSLLDAIAYAYDHKVAFVAAAGNAASNNDSSPTYPANYNVPNLMSIAATTDGDYLASFSNYGHQTVNMGAPGYQIWSTFPGNMYGRSSGTSMATPFVSGVAALVMREAPQMSGYQVKSLIFGANEGISSLVGKTTEQSRLNSYRAILAAKSASITSDQPTYNSSLYMRAPASTTAQEGTGGCGLVTKIMEDMDQGGPTSPQKNVAFFALLLILAAPFALSMALKNRAAATGGEARRRHPRYHINSQVRVQVGDRELVGQVSTISLGGVQLNTDALLEQGGIVKMQIASPDGKDQIEVAGHIVWSEEQKHYGVAFSEVEEGAVSAIQRWTKTLLKA